MANGPSKFKPMQGIPVLTMGTPGSAPIETPADDEGPRILKGDSEAVAEGAGAVRDFEFNDIKRGLQGYADVKAKYGALAASDPDRKVPSKRDSRFLLNPMSRERLAIEEEERRVVEERVRKQVQEVQERAQIEAQERGYQDGLKRGYEEAHSAFVAEAESKLTSLDALVAEFEGVREAIFQANERYLMELIFRVSRSVLLRDLQTDRDYVTRLARTLVERVGARDNIRLRVNHSDFAAAADIRAGLEKSFGALKNLNIEIGHDLDRGGCVLETDWNLIDAGIDRQIEGLREALLGPAQKAAPAPAESSASDGSREGSGEGSPQ